MAVVEIERSAVVAPARRRSADWVLIALGVALAVPYLVMGPGWLLDDWVHLRNGHYAGWTNTAEYLFRARPGAALVFGVTFGAFHDHPALLYVVQAAVMVGNAVAFRHLLARFVADRLALAAAVAWLLLPIRSATDHWASTLNASVATLLMLVTLIRLERARTGSWTVAAGLMLAATACYEAVLPAAVLAVLVAAVACRRWMTATGTLAALGALAGFMYLSSPKAPVDAGYFDVLAVPGALFGEATFGGLAVICAALVAFGCVVALTGRGQAASMVMAGVVVIAVGYVAFARFPIELVGIGDRANVVSSFGAALVLAGAAVALTPRLLIAAVVAVVVMVPVRLERDADYAWAVDEAVRLTEQAQPTAAGWSLGACPSYRSNVTGLQGYWDAAPAVQYAHRDPWRVAGFDYELAAGLAEGDEPTVFLRAGEDGVCR